MKTIKMVAKLGDQKIPVGTCNSAQARILVRDDLAAWQDGELILFIRNAHLALLDSNPGVWHSKSDDANVSQAELDRRKAWFLGFIPKAVATATTPARDPYRFIPYTMTWDKVNPIGRIVVDPALVSVDPVFSTARPTPAHRVVFNPEMASKDPDEMGSELIAAWKSQHPVDTSEMDAEILQSLSDLSTLSDPFLDQNSVTNLAELWESEPLLDMNGDSSVVEPPEVIVFEDDAPEDDASEVQTSEVQASDDTDWMQVAINWYKWYTGVQALHHKQPPEDWDGECLILYGRDKDKDNTDDDTDHTT